MMALDDVRDCVGRSLGVVAGGHPFTDHRRRNVDGRHLDPLDRRTGGNRRTFRTGPGHDNERREREHLGGFPPCAQIRRGIGTQHQEDLDRRVARPNLSKSVDRVGGAAAAHLGVAHLEPRLSLDQGLHHLEADLPW